MKNLIILFSILLISITAPAQGLIQYLGNAKGTVQVRGALKADSVLYIPIRDTTSWSFSYSGISMLGMIQLGKDSLPYYYNGKKFMSLAGSGGGPGPTNAFVQSGNAFGAPAVLGTTDANSLSLRSNNVQLGLFDDNLLTAGIQFAGIGYNLQQAISATTDPHSVVYTFTSGSLYSTYMSNQHSSGNKMNIWGNSSATGSQVRLQVFKAGSTDAALIDISHTSSPVVQLQSGLATLTIDTHEILIGPKFLRVTNLFAPPDTANIGALAVQPGTKGKFLGMKNSEIGVHWQAFAMEEWVHTYSGSKTFRDGEITSTTDSLILILGDMKLIATFSGPTKTKVMVASISGSTVCDIQSGYLALGSPGGNVMDNTTITSTPVMFDDVDNNSTVDYRMRLRENGNLWDIGAMFSNDGKRCTIWAEKKNPTY